MVRAVRTRRRPGRHRSAAQRRRRQGPGAAGRPQPPGAGRDRHPGDDAGGVHPLHGERDRQMGAACASGRSGALTARRRSAMKPHARHRREMKVRVAKLLALLSIVLTADQAAAQADHPSRPVRIVVPSSPGGGTDILARVLADHLSRSMSGQFFVENRPGAGQMIGIESVARAAPDGYTLLMAASTLAINPAMYRKVSYDALKDFAPITQVAGLPNVLLVHPSLPVRTLQELIALAKEKPGHLTYASAGIGTSP